jgi:NAD(P)-dependent dehydrogenase (short-subunit alcohol dehydrogenase family)
MRLRFQNIRTSWKGRRPNSWQRAPLRRLAKNGIARAETPRLAASAIQGKAPEEQMNLSKPFADRVALVTGASRGIGHATTVALAAGGATVIAAARTLSGLEELAGLVRGKGAELSVIPLDITDHRSVSQLAATIKENYQRLDILIGNAGQAAGPSPLTEIELKLWDQIMAVNLTANLNLIRAMDPLLRKSRAGRAVFITSGAAINAPANHGAYSVSKAALNALARTYAAETASTSIRVNLFNPGPTRTSMLALARPGEDLPSLPGPEGVTEGILALCSSSFRESGKQYVFRAGQLLESSPTG